MKINVFESKNRWIMNDKLEMVKKPLVESLLDVRQKNAHNLSNEQFAKIMSYDPKISKLPDLSDQTMANSNESYSRWLLKLYKNQELFNHNPEMIRNYLEMFDNAKKRRTVLPNNDINAYKSVSELENALKSIGDNLTTNQKNKDAKRNQKALQGEKEPGVYMNGAVELLFNGQEWEVWTPLTFEGSKALRRGAVWCTGGDDDYHYCSYTDTGKLYVIINKSNPSDKYQLFVPENSGGHKKEFRDKENESVNFRNFVHENSELLEFFLTQDIVTDSYEDLEDPDVNDEWDDEMENSIMYEYDLDYDDYDGTINMLIEYNVLLEERYYTAPDDYKDVATHGYLESGGNGNIRRLHSDIIETSSFITDIEWKDTLLKDLCDQYISETKNNCKLETFLNTLFNTNNGTLRDDDIFNWLSDKYGAKKWLTDVKEKINYIFAEDTLLEFIGNELEQIGWDWNKLRNNQYYGQKYEHYFPYNFENCHSVQEFYEEIADNGNKSARDILDEHNIYIKEYDGAINPEYAELVNYDDGYKDEDAQDIFNMFSPNFKYSEDEDDDTDKEGIIFTSDDKVFTVEKTDVGTYVLSLNHFDIEITDRTMDKTIEFYKKSQNPESDHLAIYLDDYIIKKIENNFEPNYALAVHTLQTINGNGIYDDKDKIALEIDNLFNKYLLEFLNNYTSKNTDDEVNEVLRIAGVKL